MGAYAMHIIVMLGELKISRNGTSRKGRSDHDDHEWPFSQEAPVVLILPLNVQLQYAEDSNIR